MSKSKWFYLNILKYFASNKAESYRNLFHEHSNFLYNLLEREPTQKERVLAQTEFKRLIEDGLLYDVNGEGWYQITEEGKKVLNSGDTEIPHGDLEVFFKKYELHSKIKDVSAGLFNDGHYKEAIQAALVEVINRVKEVSGNPKDRQDKELDGDSLMQRAFGCDGDNMPLIKLNTLQDSLDKAEQRGFMYLYKGIVGIRDKKAHLNFIQNDPYRTVEYLSLASLLMKLLEKDFLGQFNK